MDERRTRLPRRYPLAALLVSTVFQFTPHAHAQVDAVAQAEPLPLPAAVTPLFAAPLPAVSPPGVLHRGRSDWAIWAAGGTLAGLTVLAGGVAIWHTVESYHGHVAAKPECGRSPYDNVCSPVGVQLRQEVERDTLVASTAAVAAGPMLVAALMVLTVASGNWDAMTKDDAAMQVIPLAGPAPGVALRGGF